MYPFVLSNPYRDITFRWRYILTSLPEEAGRDPVLMQEVTGVETLTPTVTITDPNGAVLISLVYATDAGDGWYEYTLPKAMVALEGYYTGVVVTDSHNVDAQTLAAFAVVAKGST